MQPFASEHEHLSYYPKINHFIFYSKHCSVFNDEKVAQIIPALHVQLNQLKLLDK